MLDPRLRLIGRAAAVSPENRFERITCQTDDEHGCARDWEGLPTDRDVVSLPKVPTQFFADRSASIISENDSPDIPFRYSLNPYRGCEHGCAYCYARPTHEWLGMNAGIDFESRILVKQDAPRLLRQALCRPDWQGETVVMSGVTDCYQPAERQFKLTRSCLEVLLEAGQAVGIVTKNSLVTRDRELLAELAARKLVHVSVSVTTLDADLARQLEPRTATPAARLRAIRDLADAQIPVSVMVAPIIPALNDHEIPHILAAARDAGAQAANYVLLRLPLSVFPVFSGWLSTFRPLQAERVLGRIRETREGQVNDARFGSRMRGTGPYAECIRDSFNAFRHKLGLSRSLDPLDTSQFRPPRDPQGQGFLF